MSTSGQFIMLFILIYLAGLVDALAGGGGLIALPAYLACGINPALALGTNKLSSSIGTVVSTMSYQKRIRAPWRQMLPVIVATLCGAALGTRLALRLDPRWLKPLLLAVLPILSIILWSKHRFGAEDQSASLGRKRLLRRMLTFAFPIGAYDGFFGPGTGTFLALGFTHFCRFDLLHATTRAKILNLSSNIAALVLFLAAGRVDVRLGLMTGIAGVAGHWTGAHLGLKHGAAAIRPMIALVCVGLFIKLLLSQ